MMSADSAIYSLPRRPSPSPQLLAPCQASAKTVAAELTIVTGLKEQLADQNEVLEEVVERKSKEMTELMGRIGETVKEYEQKLLHKEEQIAQVNEKLAEGTCGVCCVP